MEKLSDMLYQLGDGNVLKTALFESKVFSAWEEIVGSAVKNNAVPQKIKGGILFIKTKNPSWANELKVLSDNIKKRINESVGAQVVHEIRFVHGSKSAFEAQVEDSAFINLDSIVLDDEEIKYIEELTSEINEDELKRHLQRLLIKDRKLNRLRTGNKKGSHDAIGKKVLDRRKRAR
ncbi:MAG: DUF721 domain-containing protein [Firmicutes bacterium]|nr:DUF721 domain-containing protein [Bacillota bacterium]